MSDDKDHPLRPTLALVEEKLEATLDEVCSDVDIEVKQTEELIRIEEALAEASDQAKRAISLRQRIEADQQDSPLS